MITASISDIVHAARSVEPAQSAERTPAGGSFLDAMKETAVASMQALREGEAAAIGGITGTVPVQTMVEQVLAAERSLQTIIAVRDKLVASYLDITRMQI